MDIPELKTQNLKFRTHSIGLIVDGTEQETGFLIYRTGQQRVYKPWYRKRKKVWKETRALEP